MMSETRTMTEATTHVPSYPFVVHMVGNGILLAGQPAPEEWHLLADQGFRVVVNIRTDPSLGEAQAHHVEAGGMQQIYLPLPRELAPEHMAAFAETVEQWQYEGLVIHCRTASRTAIIWMIYRILYDRWSQEQARDELFQAGYTPEQVEKFQAFVDDYLRQYGNERPEGVKRAA